MSKRKRKIKVLPLICAGLIVVAFLFIGSFLFNSIISYLNIKIEFSEISDIEISDDLTSNFLVENSSGTVEYPTIDTTKLGTQNLVFTVTNEDGGSREFEKTINLVDTTTPTFKMTALKIVIESIDVDLLSYVEVAATDNFDTDISIEVIGEISDSPGVYPITYTASDSSSNKYEEIVYFVYNLTPENMSEPFYINDILFVDKDIPLPADYDPGRDSDASTAFSLLLSDMNELGFGVSESSVYRSFSDQQTLYNKSLESYGNNIGDFVATPGYSEHQTGLAFDITDGSGNFGSSDAFQWLKENCAEYGFILRYPVDKTEITGYNYEAWHYRYVGVEVAREITNNNLTLEEYLGLVYTVNKSE